MQGDSPPVGERQAARPARKSSVQPLPAKSVPAPQVSSQQFYGVYIKGQKAGWAEQRVSSLADGGHELWMRVVVRLARGNERTGLELIHTNRYGPGADGRLRYVRLVQRLPGGAEAVYEGELQGTEFSMRVTAGEKVTETVVPQPEERAFDAVGELLAQRLISLAGSNETLVTYQFDPMTMKSIPFKTSLAKRQRQFISGAEVDVLDVVSTDRSRGLSLETRLTGSGQTLEMVVGPGFRLVLEDKALAQDQSQGVPDLYRLSRVPVDRTIGDATRVKRLLVRLEGLDSGVQLSDNRQVLNGAELDVRRASPSELQVERMSPDEKQRWLAATPFLDHDSSRIAAWRRRITSKGALVRAVEINREVHRTIRYTLATSPLTASEILRSRAGDCTEYSRLMTAILRAEEIPAREVSGMAYAGDGLGFAFHAWVEAYIDERWVAFDPTWNQFPVDATHIAISRDDPSPIIGLLGGLSVKVLKIEKD